MQSFLRYFSALSGRLKLSSNSPVRLIFPSLKRLTAIALSTAPFALSYKFTPSFETPAKNISALFLISAVSASFLFMPSDAVLFFITFSNSAYQTPPKGAPAPTHFRFRLHILTPNVQARLCPFRPYKPRKPHFLCRCQR